MVGSRIHSRLSEEKLWSISSILDNKRTVLKYKAEYCETPVSASVPSKIADGLPAQHITI